MIDWGSVEIPTFAGSELTDTGRLFDTDMWSNVQIPTFAGPEMANVGRLFDTSTLNPGGYLTNYTPPDLGFRGLPSPSPTDLKYSGGTGGREPGFMDTIARYASPVSQLLGAGAAIAQIPLSLKSIEASGSGQRQLERGAGQASAASDTAAAAAAPALASGKSLVPAGTAALMTGTLPPELQASVDQQINQVRNQMLQRLVTQGIDPATAEAMIADQMTQLKTQLTLQTAQQLLGGGDQMLRSASGSAGTSAYAGGTAGQTGAYEFTSANDSLLMANQALMRLLGSRG